MNTIVTSREQLLSTAKDIVRREGLMALSVRRIAAECGVAVGSLYNYFPAKGDLIIAVVEDFWKEAFHGASWKEPPGAGFLPFLEALYGRFREYLDSFETNWLGELEQLSPKLRKKGKETEALVFAHIREGLLRALLRDRGIPPFVWRKGFTPEGLTAFIFENLLMLLRQGSPDCAFLCAVLDRILYPADG